MTAHTFHRSVLREYDIRGTVGETLHAADARAIGRAYGSLIVRSGGKRVTVGYDGRLSSPMLEAALVEGLVACGLTVQRVGLGPTPMLYFSVYHLEADAGIMVTGSHNPPDFNGFKMMLGHKPFFGDDIQSLGKVAASGKYENGKGSVVDKPVFNAYIDRLLKDYDGFRPMTVAWDAGNGATGDALKAVVQRLPGRHILLNDTIDGTFPAHHPDPTVAKNLVQLQAVVAANMCDIGIGFDGDGDRIGIVDGKGRILWGDQIIALLARDVLKARPGGTIIADVKASQMLFDEIARLGGKPLMWKTGHSLIKSKMTDVNSPLAGEMSGHIFFADKFYGYDDALYVALRFLAMASKGSDSVSTLRDSLPTAINTPELRFDCPDDAKFAAVDRVKANLIKAKAKVNDIDGVRVTTSDGWWLLRASNTQAVLVARCESSTEAGLARVKADLLAALEAGGIRAPDLNAAAGGH